MIDAVDPAKDVDGFHPVNVGKLFLGQDDRKLLESVAALLAPRLGPRS